MTTAAPHARKPAGARRREIADAALRVVAAHGLGRFTAAALAAEVGVTDGALFRHFPTKEAIVLAAIERVEELLLPSLAADAADPIERLGVFFQLRVEAVRARRGISRLLVSDELAHAAPPEGVARVAALRRRSGAFVRGCLDEAAAAGALADGLDPEDAAVLAMGAILALAHAGGPGDPGRVWAALERFLRGQPARDAPGHRAPPQPRRHRRRSP
jgi:AcrR family transcriptional regulator